MEREDGLILQRFLLFLQREIWYDRAMFGLDRLFRRSRGGEAEREEGSSITPKGAQQMMDRIRREAELALDAQMRREKKEREEGRIRQIVKESGMIREEVEMVLPDILRKVLPEVLEGMGIRGEER